MHPALRTLIAGRLAPGLIVLMALATPLTSQSAAAVSTLPSTVAERSGFVQTGRYDEVETLCPAFQKAERAAVRCLRFGRTPEGRPMLALVATRTGALTPAAAARRGIPVALIQGGIHAGEIDGKDAGFLALREALADRSDAAALRRMVLVFVPVFNVDGHERFGAWNRPNQRGPAAMGWRTTAQNFNLNRDYVKADTPEMQAMLRLVGAWDPAVYVDLHVTDGAQFEHGLSITAEPVNAGDAALQQVGRALRDGLIDTLAATGALPLAFYPDFAVPDDPTSGFVDSVPPPRFSHGYFQLRNRIGVLVETHSWKDYPTRVRMTHDTIVGVLTQTASHGGDWLAAEQAADRRAATLAGQPMPLTYRTTEATRTVDFRGYAYTRTLSDVSGALMTHYDETTPQLLHLPLRDQVVPDIVVDAPRAGYVVPEAHASWVAAKLAQHGVAYRTIGTTQAALPVEVFRADKIDFAATSFESHQVLAVQGRWQPEQRAVRAGSLFVPIAQPKARLVMALFEPQAPDSLVAWGFFNNAFERKEYMEAYVAEDVARQQMAADPALAEAFHARLASDAAFAADPAARLRFFERRHASWDERYGLYPVCRVGAPPPDLVAPR